MLRILGVAALVGSTGCLPTYEPAPQTTNQAPGQQGPGHDNSTTSNDPLAVRPTPAGDQSSTYADNGDPFAIAAGFSDEGPIDVASRRHACMKMKYETLGRLLENRGVSMMDQVAGKSALPVTLATNCDNFLSGIARTATTNAGDNQRNSYTAQIAGSTKLLYCDSKLTLGYPQYEGRLSEVTTPTTASATKLLDVFVTAASEIIANIGTIAACKDANGVAPVLFNADNTCNESGITCIQGYPATPDQIALCSRLVSQAGLPGGAEATVAKTVTVVGLNQALSVVSSTSMTTLAATALDNGKRLAVAAVLSAAHSCE